MHRYGFIALIMIACVALWAQDPQSSDPKQRVKAAREYAKAGSNSIDQLMPLLKDADVSVRIEAVKSLGTIGTQRSLDPLIEATRDNDPEVQVRAVDGLVNFYLPGYIQTGLQRFSNSIKSKFSEPDDAVIPVYVTVRPEVIAALARLVSGGSSMESRANAARAAGILRGREAVPQLVEALHSKDSAVLYEALMALQKIRDPSVAPKLAFLFTDLQDRVQMAALETAGLLRSKEVLPDLRKAYDRARNEKVRRTALTAIAMTPDEGNRATFDKAFEDKDDNIRAAAYEGLGRLGKASDLDRLRKGFESEKKMKPRLALAFASVNLGATETTEFSPLQYLANTLNSKVYRGIAEAYLIELTRQPQVRENLYPMLRGGTRDEKIGLGKVLSVSGDKNSIAPLEVLTKDPDMEVADASLRALRALKARLP